MPKKTTTSVNIYNSFVVNSQIRKIFRKKVYLDFHVRSQPYLFAMYMHSLILMTMFCSFFVLSTWLTGLDTRLLGQDRTDELLKITHT